MSEEILFGFRVDKELKQAFHKACKATDRNASQLIRDHMRAYVAEHCEHKSLGKVDINKDSAECLDCKELISGLELAQMGLNMDTLEPIAPSNEQNTIEM